MYLLVYTFSIDENSGELIEEDLSAIPPGQELADFKN